MKRTWHHKSDERGAVLVLSVVGLVIAVAAAALAVDLGSLAQDKRSDQKVADLASLDAVRGLNDSFIAGLARLDLTVLTPKLLRATTLAKESAMRNGYDPADVANGHNIVVTLGARDTTKPKNFQETCPTAVPPAVPDCMNVTAVKVQISSKVKFDFRNGQEKVLTVSSIAFQDTLVPTTTTPTTLPPTTTTTVPLGPAIAGFSVGSSLLTLTPSESTLLNPIIGQMIGGSLTAVGWQGLASGNITLSALQTQLGFSALTVSQLLDANITLAQLYQAASAAAGGDSASVSALNLLKAAAKFTTTIKLGDFLKVASGAEGVALASKLNLFQLVSESAQVEALNGNHAVSISNVGIGVDNVVSTALSMTVIDPPKTYIGSAPGPTPPLSTSQVDLTVTPKIDLPVSIAGLVNARVKNDLPIHIGAAGAKAYLKAINCGASPSITVNIDRLAFSGSASGSLQLSADVTVAGIPLLSAPLLDIPTTNVVAGAHPPATDASFSYPSEFSPPATGKHVGSQPIGLGDATTVNVGTPTVLSVITLPTGTLATIVASLKPVLDNVDTLVLTPLLKALGVSVGNADVTAFSLDCPVAPTPPSTTTTVAPAPTTTTTTLAPPAGAPSLIG